MCTLGGGWSGAGGGGEGEGRGGEGDGGLGGGGLGDGGGGEGKGIGGVLLSAVGTATSRRYNSTAFARILLWLGMPPSVKGPIAPKQFHQPGPSPLPSAIHLSVLDLAIPASFCKAFLPLSSGPLFDGSSPWTLIFSYPVGWSVIGSFACSHSTSNVFPFVLRVQTAKKRSLPLTRYLASAH